MGTLTANSRRKTHHATDFRPRYPLDPFSNGPTITPANRAAFKPSMNLHDPWLIKPEQLPASQTLRRDVILVLGTPVDRSLSSFLSHPGLSHSLVIIAAHEPPPLSSSCASVLRILQLKSPLVVEDKGAIRLANILEWAERIARIWRTHGAHGADLLQFDEDSMADLSSTPRIARSSPGSPTNSSLSLGKAPSKTGSFTKKTLLLGKRRESSPYSLGNIFHSTTPNLPPVDPTQRPFDAIINYVSDHVSDKHILKQTILITSITRPFLATSLSLRQRLSVEKEKENLKRKSSLYSLPPTPPYHSGESLHPTASSSTAASSASTSIIPATSPFAHMIHILPQSTSPNLIRSLDSFLSSFAITNIGDDIDHAKQYIMKSSTLCDTVRHSQRPELERWLVADLIFHGLLDDIRGKAWIGSSEDILISPQMAGSFSSNARDSVHGSRNKSINDHSPHTIRAHQRYSTIPLDEAFANWPDKTVADLTPPPSPHSTKSDWSTSSTSGTSSVLLRPNRLVAHPRPQSEAIYNVGSLCVPNTISQTAQAPPPLTLSTGSNAPNPSRLSIRPTGPREATGRSAHAWPRSSENPRLSGVPVSSGRGSTKVLQRSKLNMIVQLGREENVMEGDLERKFSTHPHSEESVDSEEHEERKFRWRFWKGR